METVEKITDFPLTFVPRSSIKKNLMRSGRTRLLKIAFAFSGAAFFAHLHAADSTAPAAAPRGGAPEKIEFSRTTSTTPKLPRPGQKDEELLNRYGNVPESIGQVGPEAGLPAPSSPGLQMPTKAAAEKLLQKWDRKRNWAVPGAQEDQQDPFKQFEQQNEPEKDLMGEKRDGVMERYLKGESESANAIAKTHGPQRLRDLDRDRERTNNKINLDGKNRDDGKDENREERDDPKNDNSHSNGLADFDLKKFIRQQDQPNFLNSELPKASQMFRAGSFGNPAAMRDPDVDRARQREMDAKSSAEFMQILKPRSAGFAGATGLNDPINSPDLTRREMNPVLPQLGDSGANRSPFGAPPPPSSRMQDNNMFGVTGPAASSITPTVSAPLSHPEPVRAHAVIIEPPRRIN